jgi:hypothetical protein
MRKDLQDLNKFKEIYMFAFLFAREPSQKFIREEISL